jgi:nucleoside 2-deoxyribosyltransferase
MTTASKYEIGYLYRGQMNVFYVFTNDWHDADVWKHLAERLGLRYCSSDGYVMLSHAIKKMVEANGVSDVQVETLKADTA